MIAMCAPDPANSRLSGIHQWVGGCAGIGVSLCLVLAIITMACNAGADEEGAADGRNVDAAMQAALGTSPEEDEPAPPRKLVDLTKGDRIPPPRKGKLPTWQLGPTGIIGIKNGGNAGDQIRIVSVVPGSPADGKVLPGDVLLGLQGQTFSVGGDINWLAGNAIIEAETEVGKGDFTIQIWRDSNWLKRSSAKDVFGVDLDTVFKEADSGDDVYEWKEEEEKTAAVKQMAYDEFPIDGVYTNIQLKLEVMGTYSDDSPWNCPVVTKVRENAWKVITARFKPAKGGRARVGWPDVLALVASGKPEYVQLAKDWVHTQTTFCQDMERQYKYEDIRLTWGSWASGFEGLEQAIYYDATGDEFILPEVRKRAIWAALGQNGGGSWGHNFASPLFNGGMLHKCNPGYGAMNNAGGRCFFLLALAKKAGIDDPEINAAIWRADRFFRTFVDKGCIPYGYHSPYPSDDSNGKNYGAAYAFYTLGKTYEAKYFSLHSAHASFSRRGGHGSPTLWYYTPLSAHMAGPKAVQAYMRNMRPFYTLSRRHDGSFVFLGEQQPGIGGKGMRNPTATVAMHLSYPLKQLIITGKDADPDFWATDEELEELLLSARGQIKDPVLLEQIGKPEQERDTDYLIGMLDHFFPKKRGAYATQLGKRYMAGEKDILEKILPLLASDEARMRDGACKTLSACGADAVLAHMSKVVALLKDEAEFVRMQAARTIGGATAPGDKTRELELLKCVVDDHPEMTADNGNVKTAVKGVLLRGKGRGDTGPPPILTTSPFQAGFDEYLVRAALERIVTMDPQGAVPNSWDREALLKLAGPVTFSAEERQVNDAMFGGARKSDAQGLLKKHGYREYVEGVASNLRKRSLLDRGMRMGVTFKDAYISAGAVKQNPGLFRKYLDDLRLWQQDNPTHTFSEGTGKGRPPITTPMNLLIEIIEKGDPVELPSMWPDVQVMFQSELARAGGSEAQLTLCRKELADVDRKNVFRKMCAMDYLAGQLGAKAIDDVSPFLGHEQWRLKTHANELAADLLEKGAGPRLIELYKEAQARESGLLGNWNAAGILTALAHAGYKPSLPVAKGALKHHDPVVRGAAVQAVFRIGGDPELKTVFAFLSNDATQIEDFAGAEKALLSRQDDPKHVESASKACMALLPSSEPPLRRSLAWVLGQFGGEANRAAIEKAASTSEDARDIAEMVRALAYCPDRDANKTMLNVAKAGMPQRDAVARFGVHRMVGRNGIGDVSDEERVWFGREILNIKYDPALISFFGRVHTASAMQLLYDVMKKGGQRNYYRMGTSTEIAAKAVLECAEGIRKPSKEDGELAAQVLTDLVEFIEVTHLRGGIKKQVMDSSDKFAGARYMAWQALQRRAGQELLRFHNPKDEKIPEFDDIDLDI